MNDTPERASVALLLGDAGLDADGFRLEPVAPGANNQVFIVDCGPERAFLKVYFRHPSDPRDRHAAEVAFVRFAWERGIRCLPRLLASDAQSAMALFEFLPGPMPGPGEVGDDALDQALVFYDEINAHKSHPAAAGLPTASEACFSIAGHLERVDGRVRGLAEASPEDAAGRDAGDFVRERLLDAWRRVREEALGRCHEPGTNPGEELAPRERCLSPSDFGFHNAILGDDGRLRFIDFEYAGWDDPARLVADFFCQKAVPVPLKHFQDFAGRVAAPLPRPGRQLAHMALLLPVYQIKWCCILLNEFLPAGDARRRFAGDGADRSARKAEQIAKAQAALDALPAYVEEGAGLLASAA